MAVRRTLAKLKMQSRKITMNRMSISLQLGQRVEVTGKDVQGTVAYVGTTRFATGKWIGIVLDEPKGKNNGTVMDRTYFQCKENHGIFVRQSNLTLLTDTGSKIDLSSSVSSPDDSTPRATPKSRLTSSRQSLLGRSRESRSREDMTSSTTSLTPEPSNIRKASFIEPSKSKTSKNVSSLRRPKSFSSPSKKQTGFVETLKPQFTPGQVVSPSPSPSAQSPRPQLIPPQVDPDPQVEGLKDELKDATEKLETFRIKYKEKSHEVETLCLQIEQLNEFKSKIMEAQASLKKELDKAKREREEALEAREDMADMAETLEMATLDKEMAEEKAESLQKDLEQANERIEELEMELEMLRAELSDKMESTPLTAEESEITSFKMKQLAQQNDKLKDTLVRLRDLSAHEKYEKNKLLKDFEEKKTDMEQMAKTTEKLKLRVAEMEEQIAELHANVDAALGAEEMVETLGQQKMSLEDRVKELEEAVAELEELQDINDQLQEGFKEQEEDFRQELDMRNMQIWEAQRKTESVLESLADREITIGKFRELVQRIQDENQELRSQLEASSKSTSMSSLIPVEMLDFKKMFAETKAHARAIDLELRHMEVQQAQQHVQYLISFMPDSFLTRGGDNDAVMLVLLMPRLLAKCQVLMSQLRDKYPPVDTVEKANLGHSVHQFAARSRFSMHIHMLQAVLHQFIHCLNTCSPETLLKAGSSYPDIVQKEAVLDTYIDMLKKDQLDENVSTEHLEKTVVYMNSMLKTLLLDPENAKIHQGQLLSDLGKAVLSGIDSINTDAAIIQVIVQNGTGGEPVIGSGSVRGWCEALRSQVRQLRRRSDLKDLLLGPLADLTQVCNTLARLAKLFSDTATNLSAILPSDSDSLIPLEKFQEVITQNYEKFLDIDKEKSALIYVKTSMDAICTHVANITLTLQENEEKYLAIKEEKSSIEPPLSLRAKNVKGELNAVAGVKKRLENKEADIKELKLTLRSKQEELAEMSLRRDIAEKKLANITRDHELTVASLKRKLEEAHQILKRKEKEFEETMDHLQKDIDSLEMEKGELKDKLKSFPKKAAMEVVKSSPTSLVADIPGSIKVVESQLLINEIRYLRNVVQQERHQRLRLQARDYLKVLDQLGPIYVPKKCKITDDDTHKINELTKKVIMLQKDMLGSLPKVVDISKKKSGMGPELLSQHVINESLKIKELNNRLFQLQDEIVNEIVRQKQGGNIRTALTVFPTPEMVKALNETSPVPVCQVQVPAPDPKLSGKIIPLFVDIKELQALKQKLFTIGP